MLRIVLSCVDRIVSAWSPPTHSGWSRWRNSIILHTWISKAGVMFGTQDRCCLSIAPCVPLEGWQLPMSTCHMAVSLGFFSTFEPISLTPDSCMQKKGVPMVYERAAAQVQTLYVCPVENNLGRLPLIPCNLNGNTMNSTLHKYRSQIPREAAADSRPDSETGSRLSEVNLDVAVRKDLSA
jgi:hypothetical protein